MAMTVNDIARKVNRKAGNSNEVGLIKTEDAEVAELKRLSARMPNIIQAAFDYRRKYIALVCAMRDRLCVSPEGFAAYDAIMRRAEEAGKTIDGEFAFQYVKANAEKLGQFRKAVVEAFGKAIGEADAGIADGGAEVAK